jgi:hypothetical protein
VYPGVVPTLFVLVDVSPLLELVKLVVVLLVVLVVDSAGVTGIAMTLIFPTGDIKAKVDKGTQGMVNGVPFASLY